ncbi:pyridoxal-phosphate dependent enzyme [Rhizobium leguminosarum]|uniref:pyridoxal-phosphate dependent enzyme n=1 Tax=Rhizobium leguminosarum TaxID=384 RepID=UPI0021BBC353|nr:pyridoxal-phosphate dependent enzyme [Rhizobium leguminosarum]
MQLSPPPPVESALNAIGNTPVIRLRRVVPEGCAQVFLKLEYFNPTGSYKDRMAKSIIEEAERRGDLKPGMTVVEASGGKHWALARLRLRSERLSAHCGFF